MDEKNKPTQPTQPIQAQTSGQRSRRPNDVGSLQIDGFVKIFDPNSKEVYVEKRA